MSDAPVCITCGDVATPMRVVRAGDDGLADCVTDDGEPSTVEVAGMFVHIGRVPNTELLDGPLRLDETGRVATDAWMRTEQPGLFAAGDVRADSAGQAVTAAGSGANAGSRSAVASPADRPAAMIPLIASLAVPSPPSVSTRPWPSARAAPASRVA